MLLHCIGIDRGRSMGTAIRTMQNSQYDNDTHSHSVRKLKSNLFKVLRFGINATTSERQRRTVALVMLFRIIIVDDRRGVKSNH